MQQLARVNGAAVQAHEGMIEIPDQALVACPLLGFALAPVSRCVDCKVFAGLEDRFPGSEVPFERRYLLKCLGEPVRRQMLMLAAKG